jgi:hypothetical protein
MCKQYDIIPIICTGVVDTGGNLLPVSTTPAETAGGKFATGVFDTDGDGVPSLAVANISANFLEKFEMILMLFLGAWGR